MRSRGVQRAQFASRYSWVRGDCTAMKLLLRVPAHDDDAVGCLVAAAAAHPWRLVVSCSQYLQLSEVSSQVPLDAEA